MFNSCVVSRTLLLLAASTTTYSKTMRIVTFQPTNDKKFGLSKKLFTQILNIPNVEPFSKVNNTQIIHMFNEIGHQPVLAKISDFEEVRFTLALKLYVWHISSLFNQKNSWVRQRPIRSVCYV